MAEAEKQTLYTTGELAKLCATTVRTVQYYDQRGLLHPSRVSEGSRRLYSEADLQELRLLLYLRSLGLPLETIRKIRSESNRDDLVSTLLEEHIERLEQEVVTRQRQKKEASAFLAALQRGEPVSLQTMQTVATQAEQTEKQQTHRVQVFFCLAMALVQYGTLFYALLFRNWLVLASGLGATLILAFFFWRYSTRKEKEQYPAFYTLQTEASPVTKRMLPAAVFLGLLEYGTLFYGLRAGQWLPFWIGMSLVIVLCLGLTIWYLKQTAFLCPECRRTFEAPAKEVLFAFHMGPARRMHCPHCGYHGFCLETPRSPR